MKRASFWAVIACLLGLVVVACVWPVATWHRIYADFWLPDTSRVGPNLVAAVVQWFVIATVAVIVYPPLRRWAKKEWDHLHAKMDHNADVLHHIVTHSKDIPNEIDGVHIDKRRPHRGRPGAS